MALMEVFLSISCIMENFVVFNYLEMFNVSVVFSKTAPQNMMI